MADEHDQILSTEAEDELLTVETDPKEKTPTDVHPDPMFSMMQNVNRNRGAMARWSPCSSRWSVFTPA